MQLIADPGLSMAMLTAPAGSAGEDALRLLAGWAAPRNADTPAGMNRVRED